MKPTNQEPKNLSSIITGVAIVAFILLTGFLNYLIMTDNPNILLTNFVLIVVIILAVILVISGICSHKRVMELIEKKMEER